MDLFQITWPQELVLEGSFCPQLKPFPALSPFPSSRLAA
jgi:hypothetical protein